MVVEPLTSTPPISVVVCTRERPAMLTDCLSALLLQDYGDFEVIVVDNAPATQDTESRCAGLPVTYVVAPDLGLSRARNCGIRAARHEILAFIDDDAIPELDWLSAIARALQDPAVMVVTGQVEAAELTSAAQHQVQAAGGMSKGVRARDFHRSRMTSFEMIAVQAVGVGANMAFRRTTFDRIGEFDVRLGAGSPARGAEDLDIFHRALAAGLLIRYDPRVLVRHRHRREAEALRRQMFDTGCGFGVYLFSRWRDRSPSRPALLLFTAGRWLPWLTGRVVKGLVGRHALPASVLWAQLCGAMHAPRAFRITSQESTAARTRHM